MTRRTQLIAAVVIAMLGEAIGLIAIAYLFVPVRPGVPPAGVAPAEAVFAGLFLVGSPLVGAVLAVKRPGNPAGWLFEQFGLWLSAGFAADGYVRHAPPDLPTVVVGVAGSTLSSLGFGALIVLLMLFPTNRLPSRRWLVVPAFAAGGVALEMLAALFSPTADERPSIPGLVNPIGQPTWVGGLDAANALGSLLMQSAVVAAVVLLAIRFRRARGDERQQLKWFAWAAGILASLLAVAVVSASFAPEYGDLAWAGALSGMSLLPAAAAIAILRHRLFDIDLLINRTLVYLALSVVLAAAYAISVLLLTQLLDAVVPGNALAVAASTLLVAALFQPARRRIQAAVDSKFYRQRYSAAREIAGFGAGLRDEVDPAQVEASLRATVARTVQPSFASIWLRSRSDEASR